eukprot:2724577-Pyramimonas_sp.AAC.1
MSEWWRHAWAEHLRASALGLAPLSFFPARRHLAPHHVLELGSGRWGQLATRIALRPAFPAAFSKLI